MAQVDETVARGIPPIRCAARTDHRDFTMNRSMFPRSATWHPILMASDEEKLRAYSAPCAPEAACGGRSNGNDDIWATNGFSAWGLHVGQRPAQEPNEPCRFKTIGEIAKMPRASA